MDLSKAFETLDHYLLIAKLHAKNREYLCSIIFLRDCKEQRFVSVSVAFTGCPSKFRSSTSSVSYLFK